MKAKQIISDIVFEIKYTWAMFYHKRIRPIKTKYENLKWSWECKIRNFKINLKWSFSNFIWNFKHRKGLKRFSFRSLNQDWGWMK